MREADHRHSSVEEFEDDDDTLLQCSPLRRWRWRVLPSAALADELLGSYVARISWKDHEASDGYRLDTAAQVVRQDRANVHKHIQTDEEDDIDVWFTTNAKRGRFEQMLNKKGAMNEATRSAILHGEPLIEVDGLPQQRPGRSSSTELSPADRVGSDADLGQPAILEKSAT